MAEQHPITPPPELVQQIRSDALHKSGDVLDYELRMIHASYRAGADQELEACCEWIYKLMDRGLEWSMDLRAARRPKPPSLKEQALEALRSMQIDPVVINGVNINADVIAKYDTIRRALEQLDD